MPPKKREAPPPRRPATPKNDPFLLDEFSHQDLSVWKRKSALLNQYRVKQFYELESLREIHREELTDALRSHDSVNIEVTGWTRIVDYRYSLRRIDSRFKTADGRTILRQGRPHLTAPIPPPLDKGEVRLANLFQQRRDRRKQGKKFKLNIRENFSQE